MNSQRLVYFLELVWTILYISYSIPQHCQLQWMLLRLRLRLDGLIRWFSIDFFDGLLDCPLPSLRLENILTISHFIDYKWSSLLRNYSSMDLRYSDSYRVYSYRHGKTRDNITCWYNVDEWNGEHTISPYIWLYSTHQWRVDLYFPHLKHFPFSPFDSLSLFPQWTSSVREGYLADKTLQRNEAVEESMEFGL